jgi:predicted nucleic acid-binding protein
MKCLDRNAVIAVLNDRPAGTRGRLAQELANGERIGIPAIALFELIYGYEKSTQRTRNEAAPRALLTLDTNPCRSSSPTPSTPARSARSSSTPARRSAIAIC